MQEQITFSVLLPVYNAEAFVGEAIQSILDQTFTDYELLLLNDGSTDNSKKVLESFDDPRIQIIENPQNLGLIETLNRGIQGASGKYIIRMDADDISLPQRFQVQFDFLSANPDIDIFGANGAYFGGSTLISDYPLTHEEIAVRLIFENPLMHPTVVIKRSSLLENNLSFNQSFVHGEDWALWIDAYQKGLKFGNVKDVLLEYRLGTHNITVVHKEGKQERLLTLYEKVFRMLDLEVNPNNLQAHYILSFGTTEDISEDILIEHFENLKVKLMQNYDATISQKLLEFKSRQFVYRSADLNPKAAMSFARKSKTLNKSILAYILKKRLSKQNQNS